MKPWEEEWVFGPNSSVDLQHRGLCSRVATFAGIGRAERQQLTIAAPAMARALCMVEFGGHDASDGAEICPGCYAEPSEAHGPVCWLDLALTAAGLDAAARAAVRKAAL